MQRYTWLVATVLDSAALGVLTWWEDGCSCPTHHVFTAVFKGRDHRVTLGREPLLTHLLLIREDNTGLSLPYPTHPNRLPLGHIWSILIVGKARVGSGSFILSGKRPARRKVIGESFRAAQQHLLHVEFGVANPRSCVP